MNKLYEVLEICLQEIEQGADVDTVLFRYPDFADELRPILEASAGAKNMAAAAPSVEIVRRNRAKVLQHAAQMRESKVRSSRRIWFASLRRVAVTLAVVTALFVSGTGLVRAASTTVPGDNLYPVKRTWEDVLLLFTFNLQQREALEIEHENERLHELRELFAEGRDANVEFAGLVTSQDGDQWIVAGIPVVVSPQTEIRDQGQGIVVGSAVRVEGHTQNNGAVLAEEIKLLPPDAKLPNLNDDHGKKENHEGEDRRDNSGKGSDDDEPKFEETEESDSDSEKDDSSIDDSKSGKNDSDSDDGDNSGSGGGSDDDSHDGDDNSGGDDSGSGGGDDD
ncbi:MAG TPA: DUF5666 domain-containing protein [Anaerolineales bacterium]|nr:DUF5666 domain-containing protein [Anaerolineales bacterium]